MKTVTAMTAVTTLATGALAGAAGATTLDISVTNTAPSDGFTVTPLFSTFHDGSFDPVDLGETASPGLEDVAEFGRRTSTLAEELEDADPDSTSTVLTTAPPIQIMPGETASARVDLNPESQRFFSYFAMLVPSNDTFLAEDDPTANPLFDADGNFLGDQTIEVTGNDLFDAGTEVNNPDFGPAFVAGEDITEGETEGGVIGTAEALPAFAGVETLAGYTLAGEDEIDFTTDPGAFDVASIEISEVQQVAPVPVPGAGLMLVGGLGLLGAGRHLRRRR